MDWVPTRALGRAILVAGLLLLLAAVFGRVDLVVLAAPFALGTALSLRRRPVSRQRARARAGCTAAGVPGDRTVRRRRGDAPGGRPGRPAPFPPAGRGRRTGRGARVRARRPVATGRLAGDPAHAAAARR